MTLKDIYGFPLPGLAGSGTIDGIFSHEYFEIQFRQSIGIRNNVSISFDEIRGKAYHILTKTKDTIRDYLRH